jgi:hypothetical protein
MTDIADSSKWTGPSRLYEEQVDESRILSGDLTFDELVKLDAQSLQNVCRLNKYYGKFCSKDNKQFWRVKLRRTYRLLGEEDSLDAKALWVKKYKEVRKRSDLYFEEAVEKDDPNIIRALTEMNIYFLGTNLEPKLTKIVLDKKYKVFNYILGKELDEEAIDHVIEEFNN